MRTALLTGLVTGAAFALLNFGHTMSNADFVYMCAAVDLLKHGVLLASPYFPPGYPLLIWGIGFSGLAPLDSAVLLSALGIGLSCGALAYVGRLWRLPPMAALGLGLLGATLPDVFQIGCNPHLDALYTGLGMVLLAVALRSFAGRAHAGLAILAMLCTVVLHQLQVPRHAAGRTPGARPDVLPPDAPGRHLHAGRGGRRDGLCLLGAVYLHRVVHHCRHDPDRHRGDIPRAW